MNPLIQCRQITHAAGTKQLFKDLSLSINEGSKTALVGHNGSGKSTLLGILNGTVEVDAGDISRSNHLVLESVEQFLPEGLNSFSLLDAVLDKIPREEQDFSQYKAEQLLDDLGFETKEYDFKVKDLSGGQQNRLMFARAVINAPNLILFDEPTNHLDLRSLMFFEAYLQNMATSFVIISHDRAFLDAVTDRTLFLRDQTIYDFDMPFSKAKQALEAQDENAAARLRQEEKTIKQLSESARRLATWGKVYDNEKLAAKAKTIEKRVEKLEASKTFVSRGSGLSLTLEVQTSRANRMLQIEQHQVLAPTDKTREAAPITLFNIEDFYIRPGDRIALLGHNGAGKTTLINELMYCFEDPSRQTSIRFNPQCDIGYYDQEINELDPALTLLGSLRANCAGKTENDFKAALIKAGFPYLDHNKKVSVLSGGEKARLMFLIIKLNAPNFLILDEPTNHIDIQGKEELETQILESNATVLITSHDRRFVDTIAQRYVLITDGALVEINDPTPFYRSASQTRSSVIQQTRPENEAETINPDATTEDELLSRLVALETLLEEDLARKPKFQKPKLQARWRSEITNLQDQLD